MCITNQRSLRNPRHLILDLVTSSNFAWRMVHNNMLMHCSVALDNLSRTIPVIDSDQTVVFLHAPFRGTTLFGGELAKLHRANKERARSTTVYPAASPQTYSTVTGLTVRVASPTGEVAGIEIRVDPPLRPQILNSKSGTGQATVTVTVPQDSKKRKAQSNEGAPHAKHPRIAGKPKGDK